MSPRVLESTGVRPSTEACPIQGQVRQDVASTEDGRVRVTAEVGVQGPSILHQDLLRRLLADPEFFESVRRRLEAPAVG